MDKGSWRNKQELNQITEQEWEEIWKRLQLYIWKRFRWCSIMYGLDLEGIIQEAILSIFEGRRRWPPVDDAGNAKEGIGLIFFLCEVIRSIVSHEIERMKKIALVYPLEDHSEPNENHLQFLETLLSEDDYKSPYRQAAEKEFKAKVLEALNDEMLAQIFDRLYERVKPNEIAKELGISIEDMRAAQKRLRRIVKRRLEELGVVEEEEVTLGV